ncbi:nucleotidyl transferase AbiEii/AbiGii toxin family protein [Paenibacillus sp. WLX1005]|uniref:nucleotidyl transferase AbiEii/AbiGii toxin family protein n=1 Tax=Paenibacillus sp. WLX1005 TaxID=3243766 RepID=UPI0039841AC6
MMQLYEDRETFEQLVILASQYTAIPEAIIEKDYYVSLLLNELSQCIPDLIFKGGTSLSKAYRLIERFSEDIDLSIFNADHHLPAQRDLKYIHQTIMDVVNKVGLVIQNPEHIRSRGRVNRYEIIYDHIHITDTLKDHVLIETYFVHAPYPCEKTTISNYIYDYIQQDNLLHLADQFTELVPFDMKVQSLHRTFIDKLFAICDKYEARTPDKFSRHLYDLYHIWDVIQTDQHELLALFSLVQSDLSKDIERNPSSATDYPFQQRLIEILDTNFFENDYNRLTMQLFVHNSVPYDQIVTFLRKVFKQLQFNARY